MEAASVTVKLSDEEKKFENCVQLGVTQNTMTLSLTSAVCRTMHQFFICQLNGISDSVVYLTLSPPIPLTRYTLPYCMV